MLAVYLLLIIVTSTGVQNSFSLNDFRENEVDQDRLVYEPTYFVVASKVVRPGQVYRVSVTVFRSSVPVTVRASVQRNGVELSSALEECRTNIPETLLLKIPPTSVVGVYKLRVEGNVNGVLGGAAFLNETYLEFSQRTMTIFIQTDCPIYRQGQTVRFRTIPITTDLKAFSDAVDVYMLDPEGTIMKRWLSRQSNLGAVSLEYPLSLQPVYGRWIIRVVAQGQIEEKTFVVEEYYQTRFEVNVTVPAFFMITDSDVHGYIVANYTSGAPVPGNLTLKASVEPLLNRRYEVYDHPPFLEQTLKFFPGYTDFSFSMSKLARLVNQLEGSKVTLTACVGEHYLNRIECGYSAAVIFNSSIKLAFLGSSPQTFKPNMPFKAYVAVSYSDGSPLPSWQLATQKLKVKPSLSLRGGGSRELRMRHELVSTVEPGLWEIEIDLYSELGENGNLESVRSLQLEAYYEDDSGAKTKTTLTAFATYSPSQRHLQVTTSTKQPKVGEYIILHVRADYFVENFSYLVISKGIILLASLEQMSSSIKTFAVALSPEMAPSATVVVYDIAREGEVIVDSLTFPVDGVSRNNFTISLNNRKDKTGDTVEVIVRGEPGSYVGLSAADRMLFTMQAGNELSYADVMYKMNTFDEAANGTLTHIWHSREGHSDSVFYFPSSSYGIDANRTFEFARLVVFTDANVTRKPDRCNRTAGFESCVDEGCYPVSKRCDTYWDCDDGSDESGCPPLDELNLKEFRLQRFNRILNLYENSWLWEDVNIGPLGYFIFNVPVLDIPTNWMVSAFGIDNDVGFGILNKAIEFSSIKPFYMNLEMPSQCMQGEQVGLRVTIFNYMLTEIEVTIVLANSPDYKFVHVEALGRVQSYQPRTSFGEHQHLVFVHPGRSLVVYFPIVPTKLGDINVTVVAKTQVSKDKVTKTIRVESDGVPQPRHTSLLLDLSQGAYLIKYLDTNITETPIVPFQRDRRYVFGSNKAKVSVFGDVVGAVFPTMPMNASSLLNKPFDCGEQSMFNFAANLYTLHYMRLTGQRKPDLEKEAFKHLNIEYQRQLTYQNHDGSFRLFRWDNKPSVWLTAFCARIFHKASFHEWENFLYIDPDIINKAMNWLLKYQSEDGGFYETTIYPYDRKMNQTSERLGDSIHHRNISLTAHVLITLSEVKNLRGYLGSKVAAARTRAMRYLEKMLHIVKQYEDPFDLAIVTYALTLCNSVDGEEAFNMLDARMRETSGLVYWGKEPVPPPKTTIENNRPYLIPRLPHKYDSSNIAATAFGLLVHVARQAVIQKEIVRWLSTQRLTDGGWASTQDTIIAYQGLMEYAIQSRLSDVIGISLTVEAPSTPGFVKHLYVGEDNLSQLQSLEIPNAWGPIIVKAQGSGLGILQMSIQHNVDWNHLLTPPPVKSFSLKVRGHFYGRNSSHVTFHSCQRWINQQESIVSGMAVLEVGIPTGYFIQQQELDEYIRSHRVRNLQEARFTNRKVIFYFDYLDAIDTCVSFTVHRWYPVANMTRYLSSRVYEYYTPERYNETMYDVYHLYALDICQVCGSYQCPYCPVFSWAPTLHPDSLTFLSFTGFILFVTVLRDN
ncbi:CD109 antigen-like isoform X2 [Limulus polyphemus]|uniref:CD109 antigen-like isoform X2 n=1 Tax=Limulus polyphemus TaxID=6850 RepID=A0ABM1B8E1_LIMPO|nr:CD109 antigen-like isoform X2 [Limulus polyphemus]